jgi:2-succinyl-5-enolpyruvyl-6-hydroxy-3-cyclohexene-1-carboxylate synthase
MISTKKHVQQLAFLLQAKGITDVVISPGSRNGPLIHTLVLSERFNCRSIVDERSAAYFALGLAQALQKPVALVCSSGTAALNYAPAVAEAFYQNIPLVVITADRPGYWINQGENQTIPQENIYRDFCKKEITLPMGETEKELWFASRIINETLNTSVSGLSGPVHINIPLEEPLHDLLDENLPPAKVIEATAVETILAEPELGKLAEIINNSEKILILAGQQNPNSELEKMLADFSKKTGAVVLKEHLSNLNHPAFCSNIDTLITSLLSENKTVYRPDLLITIGGTCVSKPLKQFLRQNKPENHWHLSLSCKYYDTYQSLTRMIAMKASSFFLQLSKKAISKDEGYLLRWQTKEQQVMKLRDEFIQNAGFCDMAVFNTILKSIPENTVIHLGNSSPVRYAMICDSAVNVQYYGNRGTSGIDGSLSTAVGFASASDKINTIILGDLSFFYDSNALWNNYIDANLRIIVIHNGGGNIFSMIKGPDESPAFNEFFFTENKTSAKGIAQTFELDYFQAGDESELEKQLHSFYSEKQQKAAILEIFTDAELNAKVFRGLFKKVKAT